MERTFLVACRVANSKPATMVAEICALGCEIVRLLNTPDGQRA
jgi:hypothetical protein